MPSSMRGLPPELYRPIVKYVQNNDRRDLFALTRVSRQVQVEAERLIWRTLRADGMGTITALLSCLCAAPRLCFYVFSLYLDYGPLYRPTESSWGPIAQTLHLLTRLQSLTIFLGSDVVSPAAIPCFPSISACPFKLRSFAFLSDLDGQLLSFLIEQPELRRLRMVPISQREVMIPLEQLPSSALQDLMVLELSRVLPSRDLVRWILSRRRITHLSVVSFSVITDSGIDMSHYSSITALEVNRLAIDLSWMDSLPAIFPQLKFLAGVKFSRQQTLTKFVQSISNLHHLTSVEMVFHTGLIVDSEAFEPNRVVQRLHAACPSLESIMLNYPSLDYAYARKLWEKSNNKWTLIEDGTRVESLWERSVAKVTNR